MGSQHLCPPGNVRPGCSPSKIKSRDLFLKPKLCFPPLFQPSSSAAGPAPPASSSAADPDLTRAFPAHWHSSHPRAFAHTISCSWNSDPAVPHTSSHSSNPSLVHCSSAILELALWRVN